MSKLTKKLKSPIVPWFIIVAMVSFMAGNISGWFTHINVVSDAKASIVLKDQKQR